MRCVPVLSHLGSGSGLQHSVSAHPDGTGRRRNFLKCGGCQSAGTGTAGIFWLDSGCLWRYPAGGSISCCSGDENDRSAGPGLCSAAGSGDQRPVDAADGFCADLPNRESIWPSGSLGGQLGRRSQWFGLWCDDSWRVRRSCSYRTGDRRGSALYVSLYHRIWPGTAGSCRDLYHSGGHSKSRLRH